MTAVPLAHLVRSGFVESFHLGHAVIVAPGGHVLAAWGDPQVPILPRSCAKPLQAVGMLRAGLVLTGAHLALAAASHSGEDFHLDGVRAALAAGGLTEDDLANTPALPYGEAARTAWLAAGRGPSRVAQNCSGKHAAMLRTAQALGAPLADYLDYGHPVQRAAVAGIEELAGERVTSHGIDGCGAPVVAISLAGLARAFSELAWAGSGAAGADPASAAVATAMSQFPQYVGGTGRDVTLLMSAVPGAISKDGAEGVHAVALPDGRAAALKLADGSERARAAVLAALLVHLGVDADLSATLGDSPVLGGGRRVGSVRALI